MCVCVCVCVCVCLPGVTALSGCAHAHMSHPSASFRKPFGQNIAHASRG